LNVVPSSFPSLALAVSLSGLTLALAASCGGGGEIDNLPGTQGAAGSSSGGQAGSTAGSGGGAQQGAGGTGGSAASGGAGGAGGSGGNAGSSAAGSAGSSSAGSSGNGGGSAGSAGNGGGGGAAGAAGGAGICPPAEILPPPTCGQAPPPGLEACAACLCSSNACRSAYENCTALPGCSRIASCVFQCAASGATDGVNACSSQGNLADQFAALAVLSACETCESVCVTGSPP
jgi:hypothetical protein